MNSITDFDLEDYKENIQQSNTIPHTQILSPKDKSLPFGFFVPLTKAAEVEFSLDAPGWEQHLHEFGETEVPGLLTSRIPQGKTFVTDWVRLVLVRSTPLLAFHPDQRGRSQAVGLYYSGGLLTEWGEQVEVNKGPQAGYFKATRHLLYFLDSNNQPLHSRPLQFKAKGGFGGSFGTELRLFNQEFDRSSFGGALGASNRWDDKMRALEVFAVRLGIRQGVLAGGAKGSWFCYIAERLVPTCKPEMVGVEQLVSRKDGGEVKITGSDWRSLFIPKKSKFGIQILDNFQEYKDFGKIIKEDEQEPAQVVQSTQPVAVGFSTDLGTFEDDEDIPY